jgi:bla regulator protein blaR1
MMAAAHLAAAWWSWHGAVLGPSLALFLAVFLVELVTFGRLWPRVRCVLWAAVLAKLCLHPALTAPLAFGAPIYARLATTSADAATAAPGQPLLHVVIPALAAAGTAGILWARARREARFRRRLRLEARPASPQLAARLDRARRDMQLRRTPGLLISGVATTPYVFGLVRPTIVLPDTLARCLAPVELDCVLAHELSHVARKDLWVAALIDAVVALHWWNPVVFVARRRLRELRELGCDERAARLTPGGATAYVRTLARLALAQGGAGPAFGAAFLRHESSIMVRVRCILSASRLGRRRARIAAGALAAFMIGCVLPAGAIQPPAAVPARFSAESREWAQQTFAAARAGRRQGCFALRYAGTILTQEPASAVSTIASP